MNDLAAVTRKALKERSTACVQMPNGRLFLALLPVFGIKSREILVVYEGGGSMVYAGDRPLNKFRLIEKKFPGELAEIISTLVNSIVSEEDPKAIEGDNNE
jgi:hypothetical protein